MSAENAQAFYGLLNKVHGIAPINHKIHDFICRLQCDLSADAQKVFYLYLSLLDDGNTRISMNADALYDKWKIKWEGLLALAQSEANSKDAPNVEDLKEAEFFKPIIQNGTRDILNRTYTNLIDFCDEKKKIGPRACVKPFIVYENYLYAERYFKAKCIIEDVAKRVFHHAPNQAMDNAQVRDAVRQEFRDALNPESPFQLEERQLDAILRGQTENLIITGGPGTGKTTVICFLLWKLLHTQDYLDWHIYLAAPSGKAADRMRESLMDSVEKFRDQTCEVYKKLHELEGVTLHRLLQYRPQKNALTYNAQNPFPENSIFVIDEASMIDIVLFSQFMEALPQKNCRLFILGDVDQLPSVEAGAVLGELLQSDDKISVKLEVSKRFDNSSQIGQLAKKIRRAKEDPKNIVKFEDFVPFSKNTDYWQKDKDRIYYLSVDTSNQQKQESTLTDLLKAWCKRFYAHFLEKVKEIDPLMAVENQSQKIDEVWKFVKAARILTAEKRGIYGTQNLNRLLCKILFSPPNAPQKGNPFANGQLLMLTQNQENFKLYNGDIGIVVQEQNSGRQHLLFRKIQTKKNAQKGENPYVFYPISLLPVDALESAFAMTIHKSQGSGYQNIMIFLPTHDAHPLLNNPMIYTGVTRTQEISLTIVSTADILNKGAHRVITRDTGICLK